MNAPPLTKVAIAGQGLATSGSARRGFRIDGRWYSHVIDPRDGWPVDRVASATVIAPDAATADVVATLLSVLPPVDGLALIEGGLKLPGSATPSLGCCIVARDGTVTTDAVWDAHVR